jgi:hypothetical protein
MTLTHGITLGIFGTCITIIAFGFAYWIATTSFFKKNKLDKNNPVARFWNDFYDRK